MATRYRNRRDKDEHVLRLMTGIFMQRINSGLIKDALFCLPHWRTSRRLSWPCNIWARYEDNGARDVGWLYNKLMSELTDLGIKEEDLHLTLSTSMPDAGRRSARGFATDALDVRDLSNDFALEKADELRQR